ncbi:hypothetical protein MKW94_029095 [Papaver nudicaule]|uniref:Uncharacterized protein n=1 Tax=Papaver nudicaule TaxID=74823 RepID=A0AA42AZS0_PAPNU|nr:hypothetical protein [Papaver nudicaule]
MAKNALIFSPFFFGLLYLVLIAFVSEQGGGVRGQSCRPGSGNLFRAQSGCGCETQCASYELPAIYNGMTGLPVITGQCYEIAKAPGRYVCFCCVAFTSV